MEQVFGRQIPIPELRNTTRKTFFEVCPPEYYDPKFGGQWKPSENLLRLINGSEILFMHLDNISEKELLSLNIGWFFIDQAEEVGYRVFQILQSRLRYTGVTKRYGFLACNPEPGSWIYDKFKKPHDDGTLHKNYFLLDSTSYDNPYLPDDYIDTLKESYPDEMIKRYVEGRWDAFEGQIFTEFDDRVHVIKPFTPPKDWEYLVGVDHGMVNPTAALLAVIDYDDNVYIIDEYYNPGIVSTHAKAVHAMTEPYEISFWLIDPSTRAKTREKDGMPWSVLEEYEDYGLYFTPANNEVLASINRIKEFLTLKDGRINPRTGKRPGPQLFVFRNCVNLITEMKRYQWKRLRGLALRSEMERPQDYMDHAVDALRYIIMSRFPGPQKVKQGEDLIRNSYKGSRNQISQDIPKGMKGDPVLGKFFGSEIESRLSTEDYE